MDNVIEEKSEVFEEKNNTSHPDAEESSKPAKKAKKKELKQSNKQVSFVLSLCCQKYC